MAGTRASARLLTMKDKIGKTKAAPKKWVTITEKDVFEHLEPEQRKEVRRKLHVLKTRKTKNAEEREFLAQDDARKWNEYYSKSRELYDEKAFFAAMQTIHQTMKHAEWFAANTPYPFAKNYHSPILSLASVSCRYLRKLATLGNEHAIREIGQIAVAVCETLDELICKDSKNAEGNAEKMSYSAAQLPYWPMLHFKHTAGNNHFPRVAERLRLGSSCYINVSETANYSLQTPINAFVWQCLREFQDFHQRIYWAQRHQESLDGALANYGCSQEEIEIYRKSFQLPPLTKSNSLSWADTALMPYIRLKFPSLLDVPAFTGINTGPNGRRYAPARKAVIQALKSLARSE